MYFSSVNQCEWHCVA